MTVIVRPACMDDLEPMVSLLLVLFTQEADFVPNPERQRRALAAILGAPAVGRLLVATEDDRCVGMVSLLFTVSTAEGGEAAWLEDLVVLPEQRTRGIGAQLMEAALELCRERGISRITLLTDENNALAQRFYARFGFARSAMVPLRRAL